VVYRKSEKLNETNDSKTVIRAIDQYYPIHSLKYMSLFGVVQYPINKL
jgi:hypothetical protein